MRWTLGWCREVDAPQENQWSLESAGGYIQACIQGCGERHRIGAAAGTQAHRHAWTGGDQMGNRECCDERVERGFSLAGRLQGLNMAVWGPEEDEDPPFDDENDDGGGHEHWYDQMVD